MCLIFHRYNQWQDKAEVARGAVLVQERRCTRCNAAQRRHVQGSPVQPVRLA